MTTRQSEIIDLLHKEVKPALGCTEPIAVALAVAKAMEIMEAGTGAKDWRRHEGYKLRIEVSGNILKNGMGVGIPGTGMVGLHIAAALGASCGKSCYGLEVLHDLNDKAVASAKGMVECEAVAICLADTDLKLYVKATVEYMGHIAFAVIENDHDNIVETGFDGDKYSYRNNGTEEDCADQKSTLDY